MMTSERNRESESGVLCKKGRKKSRLIQAIVIVGVFSIVSFSSLVSVPDEATALTLRGQIIINSNADFTPANGVTGGSGTVVDPYIIEGWEIDCGTTCVSIGQTTAHFTIRDSYFHGKLGLDTGIDIRQVVNGQIENVSVYDTKYAIGLYGSSNNYIHNNSLVQNGYGIRLSGDSNVIESNTITSNGRGVSIQHSSSNNVVGNNITDNGMAVEILSVDTEYNDVSYNNIAFNTYAFYLTDESNNNTIHHNIISDSWEHVWDETYRNHWDDGYPSGGNCWDDYVAWDQYSGPDQNQPGSDGIGDMFYIVESLFTIPGLSNMDEYPLMCLPGGGWDGTGYIHRDPILIDLNDGLKNNIGITGGRGTISNPFLIEGWEISAGSADGIMIANSNIPMTIRNVYVHDGGSWYSGIRLYSAWPVRMENAISTKNNYGIEMLGASVEIVNCNIALNNNHGIWAPIGGGTIADNKITSNGGSAIYLEGGGGEILRNDISSNGGGIYLYSVDNTVIAYNNISSGSIGINVDYVENTVITENDIHSSGWGIYLDSAPLNTSIVKNRFFNNSVGIADWSRNGDINISHNNFSANNQGIWTFTAVAPAITNNTFYGNMNGIYVEDTDNIDITNNEFSHNGLGVWLDDSQWGTITHNYMGNNSRGVYLYGSQFSPNGNNTIANNTFADNIGFGIGFMDENHDNTVYHNNFLNNGIQAVDEWNANQWDNGYPSGGNFWSNYTGPDNCSGPNQDICPDSDGIGDIQFIIDADSQDRYPLIAPLGMVVPRPPTGLGSVLSGASLQDVTLTWTLSADDGKGLGTVKEYRIFRNTSFDPDGMGYALYATLPNGTSLFVDTSVGEGDPDNYFYQVCAVDLGNNTTCAKTHAGKFTRPLSQGFNIVSVPLIQSDGSIETAFQTVTFERAWSFDSLSGEWKSHMKSKPYSGDLTTIERTLGIWIDIASDSNLTVAGVVPLATSIQLKAGWNLIGFPSLHSSLTVGGLKAATGATRVEGLDSSNPPFFTRPLPDSEILKSGYGYWVMVEIDATWTISNS